MSSGRPASSPTWATRPGRRKSAADRLDAGGLQPKAGKALEDDAGEIVPVADQVSEDADEQRLLDEPRDDVVIAAPPPEQRGERDVDRDQRRREKATSAEAAQSRCRCSG